MSALALAMMLTGAVAVSRDDAEPRSPLQRPLPGEERDVAGVRLTLGPHGRIANCVVTRPAGPLDPGPDPCRGRPEARGE